MNLANFGQSVRFQALQSQPQCFVVFSPVEHFNCLWSLSMQQHHGTLSNSNSFLLSSSKLASVNSLFACELLEIRLSTVIVHCVETSVIVNQNVLRDFSTQELKKWRNK